MPDVKYGDTLNLSGTTRLIPASMMDLGLGDENGDTSMSPQSARLCMS
jgi:hypothetical protein